MIAGAGRRRRAAAGLLLACAALGSSCAQGRGVIEVSVVSSGSTVAGIDRLRVQVVNGEQDAGPYELRPQGAPVSIPPPQTFSLSFDASRSGTVAVIVEALDEVGAVLAAGHAEAALTPSTVTEVEVDLTGENPDMNGDGGDGGPGCGTIGGACCEGAMPCTAGCCSGGICAAGTQSAACGTSGTCTDCTVSASGRSCVSGACVCVAALDCPVGQACDNAKRSCSTSCGPSTGLCNGGCCNGSTCLDGSADHLCGSLGGLCTDCAGSSSGHVCIMNSCGCRIAADCPLGNACDNIRHLCTPMCQGTFLCNGGCCDDQGTCQPGTSNGACGRSGGLCLPCGGNAPTCTAGTCTSACSADGMGGGMCSASACCDAMNACTPVSGKACGNAGACVDCTFSGNGKECVNGACGCKLPADCAAGHACAGGVCTTTCDVNTLCNGGCCSLAMNGVCLAGTGPRACGGAGGVCLDCAASMAGHACVAGKCGCSSAVDCPVNQACNLATHTCSKSCDMTIPCNGGCCSAAVAGTCVAGTNNGACGNNGGVCGDCTTLFNQGKAGRVCEPVGAGGVCGCGDNGDCPNGSNCGGGLCTSSCNGVCNGGCCTAAMNGSCVLGTSASACGAAGVCVSCTNSAAGHACLANGQRCGCATAADCNAGLSCNTTTSQCEKTCGDMAHTACNGGCCQGNTCSAGNVAMACGSTGSACADCTNSGAGHQCVAGACGCAVAADCAVGQSCDPIMQACTASCSQSQKCNGGCCSAALNGVCQPGTANGKCGPAGALCTVCNDSTPTCANGACTAACGAPGNGVCSGGFCCQGGQCVNGLQPTSCGFDKTCVTCAANAAGSVCQKNGNVYYCGCATQADCLPNYACSGARPSLCQTSCAGGLTCNGGCCSGDLCVTGKASNACGGSGAACTSCSGMQNNRACITGSFCGCNAATDCAASYACNTVSHKCETTCGDQQHTACNGGCCLSGTCNSGVAARSCGTGGGACVDCSANPLGHACIAGACGCGGAGDCGNNQSCNGGKCCGNAGAACSPTPCCGGCLLVCL